MANDIALKKVIVPGLTVALATNSEGEKHQITIAEIKAVKAAALAVAKEHKLSEADVERVLGQCLAQQVAGTIKDPLAKAQVSQRSVDEDGWTTILINRGEISGVRAGDKVTIGGVETTVEQVYPGGARVVFAPNKAPKGDDVIFHNEPGKAKLAMRAAEAEQKAAAETKRLMNTEDGNSEYSPRARGH